MAYRRRQPISRASTFKDDSSPSPFDDDDSNTNKARFSRFSTFGHGSARADSSSSPSLAAQAIRASSAHRDSSLSSAYGDSAYRESNRQRSQEDSKPYEYTSMKSLNEPNKDGFWGVLARKAKSILEDDNIAQKFDTTSRNRPQMHDTSTTGQFHLSYQSPESNRKEGSPKFQKGLDAITSSLNYIGGTIGNALEEGLTIVESRTADIISETRKLQIRRKGCDADEHNQDNDSSTSPRQTLQNKTDQETQLKASRDVAMAMAAKAKLLLRELKTVKADLAFAKQRSSQLEEENKRLRDSCEKGGSPEDDDLIRLQLETLLAEKARLAHENSIYARENRFLREIVEYHQLTMQDVIYVDEGIDEVTEVCPIPNAPILDVRPITPPGPTQLDALLMSSSTGPEVIPSHPDPKRQSSPIPDEDPKRQSSPNPAEGPIQPPSPNPSRDPKRQRSPSPGI